MQLLCRPSGTNPLVSRTIAQGDPADPGSAIPSRDIGDNRPWLAFFETTQRCHEPLCSAPADRWATASTVSVTTCAPGVAVRQRRPRRNAARRRHRPDLHRAAAAQSRAIARRRGGGTGPPAGVQADQSLHRSDRSGSPNVSEPSTPSSPTARRRATKTASSLIYRKPEAGISPEIEMGRHRGRGLCQHAGLARQRRTRRA